MGSSCFSRGNKKLVAFLQNYLKEKHLNDNVTLKGAHCMGQCDKGPLVKVDEELIFHADEQILEAFLDKIFNLKEK
jgi:NADH:ubiquinone oxidoreductase subunit E